MTSPYRSDGESRSRSRPGAGDRSIDHSLSGTIDEGVGESIGRKEVLGSIDDRYRVEGRARRGGMGVVGWGSVALVGYGPRRNRGRWGVCVCERWVYW